MARGAYGDIEAAKAGLLYGLDADIESRLVHSGQTLGFGEPVFEDQGNEDEAFEGDSTDASLVFAGVAIISQRSFDDGVGEYPAGDEVNVLRRGMVWVPVASGVTACANKKAYAVDALTNSQFGKFTDSSNTESADANAYFVTNPLGGLAVIELRGRI